MIEEAEARLSVVVAAAGDAVRVARSALFATPVTSAALRSGGGPPGRHALHPPETPPTGVKSSSAARSGRQEPRPSGGGLAALWVVDRYSLGSRRRRQGSGLRGQRSQASGGASDSPSGSIWSGGEGRVRQAMYSRRLVAMAGASQSGRWWRRDPPPGREAERRRRRGRRAAHAPPPARRGGGSSASAGRGPRGTARGNVRGSDAGVASPPPAHFQPIARGRRPCPRKAEEARAVPGRRAAPGGRSESARLRGPGRVAGRARPPGGGGAPARPADRRAGRRSRPAEAPTGRGGTPRAARRRHSAVGRAKGTGASRNRCSSPAPASRAAPGVGVASPAGSIRAPIASAAPGCVAELASQGVAIEIQPQLDDPHRRRRDQRQPQAVERRAQTGGHDVPQQASPRSGCAAAGVRGAADHD